MTVVNCLHNLDNDIECQLCCTQFDHNNYDECKDCHYKICNECYDNYINKYKYKTCPQCRVIIQPENSDNLENESSIDATELSSFDTYQFIFSFRFILTIFMCLFCWFLGFIITGEYSGDYVIINFFCGLMIFCIIFLLITSCCNH